MGEGDGEGEEGIPDVAAAQDQAGGDAAVAAQAALLRAFEQRRGQPLEEGVPPDGHRAARPGPSASPSPSPDDLAALAAVEDPALRAEIELQVAAGKDAELARRMQEEEDAARQRAAAAAAGAGAGAGGYELRAGGGGGLAADADVALAIQLQQREIDERRVRWRRTEKGEGEFNESELDELDEGGLVAEVDGRMQPLGELGRCAQFLAVCSPCCVGRTCSPLRRRRYCRTWFGRLAGWLVLVQLGFAVVSLVDGGADSSRATGTGPSPETLRKFGSTTPDMYTDRELWRMVTPAFLPASLAHAALLAWVTLRYVPAWERYWGAGNVFALVFVGAMTGTVMTSVAAEFTFSSAASAPLATLLATKLTQYWLGWEGLPPLARRVNSGVLFGWLAALFCFSLLPDGSQDPSSVVSGALVGLFHGMGMFSSEMPEDWKWRRRLVPILGRLLMVGLVVLEIVLLIDAGRLEKEITR